MKNKHQINNLIGAGKIGTRVTLAAFGLLLATYAPSAFGWGITWSDYFSTSSAPDSNWSYNTGAGGWGNDELETYVSSYANCHGISDGSSPTGQALQIEAQTASNGDWYSARINTYGHQTFPDGTYVLFECKFPNAGQGYWPAAWCLGTWTSSWPQCGEIDVAESIDGQTGNYQTLHMPNWNPGTGFEEISDATSAYIGYGAWINGDGSYINFELNGNVITTIYASSLPSGATWEFWPGNNYYMILNLAIGGDFPGNPNSSTKDDGNFDIAYVQVWQN
jgi:hypothetical protein